MNPKSHYSTFEKSASESRACLGDTGIDWGKFLGENPKKRRSKK